ncbi:MAG: LacI family DNA-binding transcriptional regulator [Candidatus Kryptonium sp.]|nr:LacI family transcriptional regulator [Candidatus Kryptonium sp.]MCX7762317.1 LacI family transcriptional regulator [Candidatus Kryptonium sp.]MDW8109039.1 LacI family DNA-binding transcriptional regulator [Candidatus Kryptonium sp.]
MAREAKVGIGTVSRVLNGSPHVSEKTRKKVLEVAKRLNYQPHTYAQRLAKQKAYAISAVIPFFTSYFFMEVLRGVQSKISEIGFDLVLYGVNDPASQIEYYIQKSTHRGKVDGVLFFSMKFPESYVRYFIQHSIPIVLVDTFHPKFDSITVDNYKGAYLATEHLIKVGHEKIGMISARLESVPAKQRFDGFKQAISDYGKTFYDKFFVETKDTRLDGFNRESGYYACKELLSRGKEIPSAIFVSSDIQAIGVIQALNEKGIKVPDDVCVIGFDDIELAKDFGLTTVRQPMYEMGVIAVEKLFERINDEKLKVEHVKFTPELVIRKTCP